jgi:hypothetical protein
VPWTTWRQEGQEEAAQHVQGLKDIKGKSAEAKHIRYLENHIKSY